MNTIDAELPALAQALGRLRQTAPRPAALLEHDLLRLMPEPALAGELPEPPPPPAPAAIPGPETARTYWFDL